MSEVITFIIEHRKEPITFTLVVGFFLLVLDKAARKLIQNHVKRMFKITNMDDYAERQKRIESKVDALLKERGILWDSVDFNGTITVRKRKSYLSSLAGTYRAGFAVRFTNWRGMKMTRNLNVFSMVAGLLGAIKIILQSFGYDVINDEQINALANAAAVLVTIYGVLTSHQKKPIPTIPVDDAYKNDAARIVVTSVMDYAEQAQNGSQEAKETLTKIRQLIESEVTEP